MRLIDAEGRRLYLTEEERRAFVTAATKAPREVRTFCGVLHATGCRISEALVLTAERVDLPGRVIVFESLKKRRRGVYRAVPVSPELLDGTWCRSGWATPSSPRPRSTPTRSARRSRASPRGCGSRPHLGHLPPVHAVRQPDVRDQQVGAGRGQHPQRLRTIP